MGKNAIHEPEEERRRAIADCGSPRLMKEPCQDCSGDRLPAMKTHNPCVGKSGGAESHRTYTRLVDIPSAMYFTQYTSVYTYSV